MILYTQTPDYYSDYIEHGWLKDQAAKVHKYIERWRGKNGKWYYKYKTTVKNTINKAKSKLTNSYVQYRRKKAGLNPEDVSFNIAGRKYGQLGGGLIAVRGDNGKIKSYDHNQRRAARSRNADQTSKAIEAGRERKKQREKQREQEAREITEAFSKPEVRAHTLKNRKNYILKENYWNPENTKRQAQLDSYKKKGRKGNIVNRGYSDSKSGENSSAFNKNSAVLKKVRQKNLTSKGYHNSKSTYNSKGDWLYDQLTGAESGYAFFDPTTEGGTRRYHSRTKVWRHDNLPAQYYNLYLIDPKKFKQVATPAIKKEINNELKKRNMKTIP